MRCRNCDQPLRQVAPFDAETWQTDEDEGLIYCLKDSSGMHRHDPTEEFQLAYERYKDEQRAPSQASDRDKAAERRPSG